jgi:hypothetical protein
VRKALYGLHQALRAWNTKLDDMLLSFCFRRTPSEHVIYVQRNDNVQLVVGVYVDDLIITGSDRDDIRSFKEDMAAAFKMSNLGLLHYYFDIEVKQSASGILLSQGAYVIKILERSSNDRMQSVSCTHGGPFEAKQAKHTTAGGRHSIMEHHRELDVLGEYSF